MNILGISAFYHDSAAAILKKGEIIAAAQEERFTRKKHDASFPTNAVKFCLNESELSINDLDALVFYDKPLLKFERLLETYYNFVPRGLPSFIAAIPVWLREKLFLKRLIRQELELIEEYDSKKLKLLFPEHHLSHAASAFYPSGMDEAAILTVDGVGEWATAAICHGKGSELTILKELRFPHSIGLLYSALTYFLGFRVNSGEYKLMGLAPYGNGHASQTQEFIETIKSNLVDIKPDGSIWLNQKYFKYATGLRMVPDRKWEKLFGFPRRDASEDIQQHHCNLAIAIQKITEEVIIKMAAEAKRLTGSKNLCMAGGVALNCVANGKLQKERLFENIWIQPAAGDAGGALGGALAAHYLHFENEKPAGNKSDLMRGAYLGPRFSQPEILATAKNHKAVFQEYNSKEELADEVAKLISSGNVIGWMQGRMEFGPRALGARSILGDPTDSEMQKKLNLKIKYRESFRPFAPAVLEEDAKYYFDLNSNSPYMLLVQNVQNGHIEEVPKNYSDLPLRKKLYTMRSDLQAITHVDFSARIQTVSKTTNPDFHLLLEKCKLHNGVGMVVNTSFNVRGEPIVCTPEDAYRCFMRTEMDYLVIENFLFDKTKQPAWPEEKWQEEFVLD